MAKGIRVNQLAKELNVPSKSILDKLRDEGLGDKAPNHMSVLPLGLAESVREWFHSGHGVATAVETAAPVHVEVATKPKATRTRRKKATAATAEDGEQSAQAHDEEAASADESASETAAEVAPATTPTTATVAPEVVTPSAAEPAQTSAPAADAVPTKSPAGPATDAETPPATTAVADHPTAVAEPTVTPPAAAPAAQPQAPAAPPAQTQQQTPPSGGGSAPAPAAPATPAPPHGRVARPTVTLANRQQAPAKERKPVTPAPMLRTLEPAKIQGPKLVREEKPDVLPTPRRRPMGPAGAQPAAFTQARPTTGRGVKSAEDGEEETEEKKKAGGKGSRTLSSRRRGPDGRRGEAEEKLREFTEADLIERRDRLAAAASYRTGFDRHLKTKPQHAFAKTPAQTGGPVEIEEPITVRSLAAALGVKTNEIMGKLLKQGVFANINQALDTEVAGMVALDYGVELKVQADQTAEEQLEAEFANRQAKAEDLASRPPVVTILGHVDHGKTSLLDKIRNSNVAAGEAGGITQHTAAWTVQIEGSDGTRKRVTFIDTPGHQAFTAMRARGANMTDVVVLVVSAAEGVQPQTIESINHARAAEVPIVVAMNKIDRPDANPDMVLGQLAKEGLNPVEWGGDTEVVRTSATTGQGIKELIEILDYQAALLELKTDPTAPACGSVIESRMDEGLGAVATVLVQDGTLHVGDTVLCGTASGRVRNLLNDRGEMIQEAGAATPVIVSGLSTMPTAGEKFYVLEDMERAQTIAEERGDAARQTQLAQQNRVSAGNLLSTIKAGEAKVIHLIIKADVQGSVETLVATVGNQNTEEVKVRVVHSGVGAINESDVQLAMATRINPDDPRNPNRVAIVGFNVVPDEAARALAEQNDVGIKTYRVIYEIFDDMKKALSGMLAPEIREKLHGHVEVRQVFKVSRLGNIAGCMVTDGHIQRGSKIRLIRDGVVITEDLSMESLRRVKEDVREVKQGFECGIKLAGYDDIKVGDRFEAYIRETHQRTL